MPDWLNILLRSIGFFALALLLVRLMGKRFTARGSLFDQMNIIVLGVIAASFSINPSLQVVHGLIALALWSLLPVISYYLSMKYKSVKDIVQGKETILINHGKILEDKLLEARFTPEDLLSQLRRKNVFKTADVEFAILEPTGELSVLLKKDRQPLTANSTGLKVASESVPQTVMLDGVMMDEPLTAMGLNRNWLHSELEKVGVAPENVFIAQVDSFGQLYLDLFDDALQSPQPKTKELTYATLKKCQADCELYALGTRQQEAKKMYAQCAGNLEEVLHSLEPLLKR
ncbi:DUF421 domain-containing protein [Desulforamulus ruminis]|uniref:DUF421 domain-containing protein n=1 Tax=Desulforamulus ruminis (strain ATCC 23193 / DSM 2154 / NCIMB 8452 / DL) TaxID=696281 RepID=F6DPW4_DESRL|nr:DUF421 domain-containing protein [Desulforamulus ruminis]AEG60803.1 protein of unknown function DUF421 [Desulforamulus ruminis DSM 2154]